MSLLDNFSTEELREIVESSCSMRELSKKLGYAGNGYNGEAIKKRCEQEHISLSHFTGLSKNFISRNPDNIFIKDSTASQKTLRSWYLKGNYSEYKCSLCGQEPFWNGQSLTLTLDHINGINNDDRLENLRWVCPNCDRQLDTFCSKNKHKKQRYNAKEKNFCIDCGKEIGSKSTRCNSCYARLMRRANRPSLEQLKFELQNSNFSQVGNKYEVSDNAVRKWCRDYGMSDKASDYK